ncbi:MAG: ABC transporter permease subunit, partial [Pseudomonadota bacterium]
MASKSIPGVNAKPTTDLPVLLPLNPRATMITDPVGFSRWVSSLPLWVWPAMVAIIFLWPAAALAQSNYTYTQAVSALFKWLPLLVTSGFFFNVLISLLTMILGTAAGVILGLMQISPNKLISWPAKFATQAFRNSPWLVLLFIVLLALPFEVTIFGVIIVIPDWVKAVFGLSLPIMA